MDMSKTLSDLPTDLHYLILSHDEEKIELKKENEKLKTRVKMLQCLLDEARQDSDSDEDTDEDKDSDDEEDPDRCVKCDRTFDQRKLLNDYDCAWAWDLHCDIGDDEGGLCGACLQKLEDERCSMCNSGEHLVPKEMMWPNHTDCVFCAEPEEYAEEKNISTEEAERISKDIVANSPNGWEY
jgi:hypothetical protein